MTHAAAALQRSVQHILVVVVCDGLLVRLLVAAVHDEGILGCSYSIQQQLLCAAHCRQIERFSVLQQYSYM
jgi:hypothetical protein